MQKFYSRKKNMLFKVFPKFGVNIHILWDEMHF